ncbi:benzoate/H(+) symporter BenE family transporter [Nitrincola iocasae]|uniref:Benzoate/H(+) symporter BenE family transporter n=2 Tax=Nitrincola iocasae TaxID=2614693 RepID=A0A5J6LK19_9GAMM|nr:benzoate/H(+) symporter BenE family transporter [Nitrincola iocasae]
MKDFSLSSITAGFVAVLVGYTSSAVIIFQAAAAAGASQAEVTSWFFALGIGMGLSTLGLSLYYKTPILTAWSTPGAALLVTSLPGLSMAEATGAFIFCGALITLAGITGWFERLMKFLPQELATAMLAGVLLQFGLAAFKSAETHLILVISMFLVYLISKRLLPRYAILIVLTGAVAMVSWMGEFDLDTLAFQFAIPVFTAPSFSFAALIGVGIPLFIVTMASQNMPGIAVIKASGYNPPLSPIITWTGITTLLLAPLGAFALNLAAITAAICMSEEAHPDKQRRYTAAVSASIFYIVSGLLAASVATLMFAFPQALVLTLAGLALLSTIGNSLAVALGNTEGREAALITFLATASGMTLFGIGSAFWGLLAGMLAWHLMRKPTEQQPSV